MSEPEGPVPAPPAIELQSDNLPPPVQPVLNQPAPDQVQSHGAHPSTGLQTDNQLPPVQPPLNQSEPLYEVVQEVDQEEHTYMCPDLIPPPAEFQLEDQPPPTDSQPVMNLSAPINALPYVIQPYKGYPVQSYLPNAIPQTSGPGPVSLPAVLQPQSQPLPVQTVMNPSSNPAPHQVQSYAGYQVQNYPSNAIPQTAGPGPVPPAAGLQPQNQPHPVQPVMNLSGPSNPAPYQLQPYAGYPVQYYLPNPMPQPGQHISAYPMGGYGVPGQVPQAAGLQLGNRPPPVQTVLNQSSTSNPAPHQLQSFAGYPVQNNLPNPLPQSEGPALAPPAVDLQSVNQPPPAPPILIQPVPSCPLQNDQPNPMPQTEGTAPDPPAVELQSENQPTQVQPVLNQFDPSNPAPHQVQPYAAPAVPPPVLLYGVPPGLEYLTQIDQILIHQKIECIEILTRFETNNQYEIKNSIGQEIYHAKEDSDCIIRNIFGPARAFKMHIKDHMDQEVIQMHRPMRCFLSELEVQAPPGVTIGYVKHECSFLPKFSILGPNNEVLLRIKGPFIPLKCCGDINFEVMGLIGEQSIGRITKQRSGFIKKCISDASNFCIQFPMDMDVKMKAVLLGACLLIDILFFDKGGNLFLKLLKGS